MQLVFLHFDHFSCLYLKNVLTCFIYKSMECTFEGEGKTFWRIHFFAFLQNEMRRSTHMPVLSTKLQSVRSSIQRILGGSLFEQFYIKKKKSISLNKQSHIYKPLYIKTLGEKLTTAPNMHLMHFNNKHPITKLKFQLRASYMVGRN